MTPVEIQMAVDMWIRMCVFNSDTDITEKGRKLVQMLCDTPIPISVTTWEDPRKVIE